MGAVPYTITMAHGSGTTDMGALSMHLSPLAYCWAPVSAIAKAIHAGDGDDVLVLYRAGLLSTPRRIGIYDHAQGRLWRAHQLRQYEAQQGSVVTPTPIHTIMDIVDANQMLDKGFNKSLGAEHVAVQWNATTQYGLLFGRNAAVSRRHSNDVLTTHIARPRYQGPNALARTSL